MARAFPGISKRELKTDDGIWSVTVPRKSKSESRGAVSPESAEAFWRLSNAD